MMSPPRRSAVLETVVVIAKEPVPGRVKTRLIGDFTAEQAADLAAAALADTLSAMDQVRCRRRVLLLDGQAGSWVPRGWEVIAQVPGGLDERLAAGFESLDDAPAVLVGMDTPQLRARQLNFNPTRFDACLGMAADGGFWAIGFTSPARAGAVLRGVPMSTAETGSIQRQRMVSAGLAVQELDTLTDVDTAAEARSVALQSPSTRFARRWLGYATEAGRAWS